MRVGEMSLSGDGDAVVSVVTALASLCVVSIRCWQNDGILDLFGVDTVVHSYRVCNGAHPSYSSILHSCNFVSVRTLSENIGSLS